MKVVRTVEEFWKENNRDMEKIIRHKVGYGYDESCVEILSDFYLDMLEHGTLQKFDPDKGAFNTWIYTCLSNMMANRKRRRECKRVERDSVCDSVLKCNREASNALPLLDTLVSGQGTLKVHPDFSHSIIRYNETEDIYRQIKEFKEYMQSTREAPITKKRIVHYIELAEQGMLSTHIAQVWGVSDTVVGAVRKALRSHHVRWKKMHA